MPLSDKAKKAYDFFIDNQGNVVNVHDIAETTGWNPSTVKTYVGKKWRGTVIDKLSPNYYRIIIPANMTAEQFDDLQTQIDHRVK